MDKIRSLEDVISNTDAHFEQEIDKLRQELEEEYRLKLIDKLEQSELLRRDLENEISHLRHQLRSNSSSFSSDSSSVMADNENCTGDMDPPYYSRPKQSRRETESVEQAYQTRFDQMQEKFEAHLRQMQAKYEADTNRIRSELSESYKQALSKAKSEIDQLQAMVQRLKKTNMDSDKVIESLKLEMNKMKESHLDELTMMKMNAEREKEGIKDRLETAGKRAVSLERHLIESEDKAKKQCETLKSELKLEYGTELRNMNAKMKDMMRSHASAIEMLKKQHQNAKQNNFNVSNRSCQVNKLDT